MQHCGGMAPRKPTQQLTRRVQHWGETVDLAGGFWNSGRASGVKASQASTPEQYVQ